MAIIPQPCDSVKCGPNAHCLGPATGLLSDEEQQTNQTLCVCNEGQIGDPYDEVHGCQSGKPIYVIHFVRYFIVISSMGNFNDYFNVLHTYVPAVRKNMYKCKPAIKES